MTPLAVTVLMVVILKFNSIVETQKGAVSNLAVTVFVSVDVVHLFTLIVQVEVGSVVVTLTYAIPDAIVTGLGVLGAVVRCLHSKLHIAEPSHCVGHGGEKRICHGALRRSKRVNYRGRVGCFKYRRGTHIWKH